MTGSVLVRLLEAARLDQKHRSVLPAERKLQRALRSTWARQGRAVQSALRSNRPAGYTKVALTEALDPGDERIANAVREDVALVGRLEVLLVEVLARGAAESGRELSVTIGADFAGADPGALAWLAERAGARVAGIDEVTRAYVRTILTDAGIGGWSYQRTSKALRERFAGFSAKQPQKHLRNRGEMIAVTEIGEAYEHGGRLVAKQLQGEGLDIEKQWLVAGDARVCPICAPAGTQGWIDENTAFSNGFDGPLGHPGCRCATARRVRDDDDEGE